MALTNKVDDFLADLNRKITTHERCRRVDAGFYQFLVIGAALSGFASLAAGLYYKSPEVAGVIGGLTSVATILAQQLRCVKAIDWRYRASIELEAIKSKLMFEGPADDARVAALSAEVRELERRMPAHGLYWRRTRRAAAFAHWRGQTARAFLRSGRKPLSPS